MGTPQETKQLDGYQEKWFDFVLEEYTTLRNEVSDSLKNQQSIINYGLGSIGILIAFSANLWGKQSFVEGIFIFFIPFICNLIILIWNGEVRRMSRAGQYIKSIEDKIHYELSKSEHITKRSLNWETFLRQPKANQTPNQEERIGLHKVFHRFSQFFLFLFQRNGSQANNKIKSNYIAIIMMFAVLSLFSISLGFAHHYSMVNATSYLKHIQAHLSIYIIYVSALVLNSLFFIYHYRYFEKAKK